jgi:hypothetical protein
MRTFWRVTRAATPRSTERGAIAKCAFLGGYGCAVVSVPSASQRNGACEQSRAGVDRERLSRSTDLQQFEHDSLLGLGFGAARANSPGCQGREVGRSRAAAVSDARIRIGR